MAKLYFSLIGLKEHVKWLRSSRRSLCSNSFPSISENVQLKSNRADQNPKSKTDDAFLQDIFEQGTMENTQKMENLCHQMVKERCSEIDYFIKNHNFEEAFRVFHITNPGKILQAAVDSSPVNVLNDYMKFLCDRDQIYTALDLLKRMPCPNSMTFEILLVAVSKPGRFRECLLVVDKFLKLEECTLSSNCYYKVIHYLCGLDSRARNLFAKMKLSGFSPDHFIYDALIKGCCTNHSHVVDLVNKMVECGLAPKDDIYAFAIKEFSKRGTLDEAAKLLHKMSVSDPYPHNILLKCYFKDRMYEDARNYFKKMVEKNITDFGSWSVLIRGFFQDGMVLEAFDILHRAITSWFPDHTICTETKPCDFLVKKVTTVQKVKSDDLIRLYSLAYQLGFPCNTSTYNNMLVTLYESGRTKGVLSLFSLMLVRGCGLYAEAYSVLIHTMCKENKMIHCAHLLDMMATDGLVPSYETLDCVFSCMASHSQMHMFMPTLHKLASNRGALSLALYYMVIGGLWKKAVYMLIEVSKRRVLKTVPLNYSY